MEDMGKGWELVELKTKEHYDKVNWKGSRALQDFFHGQLFSDPDNQNKEKFRIDLGIDPTTKAKIYALHPRRAQKGTTRALLQVPSPLLDPTRPGPYPHPHQPWTLPALPLPLPGNKAVILPHVWEDRTDCPHTGRPAAAQTAPHGNGPSGSSTEGGLGRPLLL
jgi:hypothetical protein